MIENKRYYLAGSFILLLFLLGAMGTAVKKLIVAESARGALMVQDPKETPNWLKNGKDNLCKKDPCLVIEQEKDKVTVLITTFDPSKDHREVRLTTVVELKRAPEFKLVASHEPTPSITEALEKDGVNLAQFEKEVVLYEVDGWGPTTEITIELPYGVLPQFFFDGFQKIDRAMGNRTDVDDLTRMAETAATQVSQMFGLASLGERSRVAQVAWGPIQTLTYLVAVLALVFTALETRLPNLKEVCDGLTDLIPFTGFLGTLVGVAEGLKVLGMSDVTNDVSKALALGKIGSSLGLAINTTILAIIVFGIVLLTQYVVRTKTAGTRQI